ncbi:hypothetical protein E3H11_41910 [Bradyrhizobium brasilense]|uniref:3-hydroxyacyl-CoA dehydrogenase NAD-binding domain-containing protein n=1 Tax=Bradyrhizobium brasilense TaxID=1419277 RepID=UPI0016990212|nr:hypothetical protein [Bradyrhizobium brasilense]
MGLSLPSKEGTISIVNTVEEAVQGVDIAIESAPERLELKQKLLPQASKAAPADLLICSSTSGFMPSDLQKGVEHSERLIVAHPFSPVYLLPLVELCGVSRYPTAPSSARRRSFARSACTRS